MKYTSGQALVEILLRREKLIQRRSRRACRALSGTAGLLFAALVAVIGLGPEQQAPGVTGSVYGSFLLSPQAGGYVLAAVIAFALGVAVTLLILNRTRNNKEPPNTETCNNKEEAP